MDNVLNGVKVKLERFSPRQLVVAGLLLALILGSGGFLYKWFTTPDYDVLFSGLAPADAAAVVAAVDATGTSHKIVESGTTTTVLVPAADVSALRMNLAAENLPGDSVVGYELLDAQGVTVSTFREQVNYQRALEGELSRTLSSLDAVESASVHIVLPRERLYTSEEAPATASVTVGTSGALDRDDVAAITHLVASSVPDLDPSQVTVTDSSGELLTDAEGGIGGGGTGTEAEAAYATRLESRASTMLAAVVGEGKALVRVQADLDFTARTRQTELFDPEKVATDTQKTEKETYSSREAGNGGTLTTNPQAGQDAAVTNDYTREAADTDFSVSREVTSETDAPGEVRRLTVSVLLDPDAAGDADAAAVEDLVSNAVGLDANRGDAIVVEFLGFTATDAEQTVDPAIAAAAAEQRTKLIVGATAAGALLLAVLFGGIMMLRGRKKNKKKNGASADEDVTATVYGSPLPGTHNPDPNAQLGVPSSSGGEADRLLERVADRPEAAADVLRGLLASDEVRR